MEKAEFSFSFSFFKDHFCLFGFAGASGEVLPDLPTSSSFSPLSLRTTVQLQVVAWEIS